MPERFELATPVSATATTETFRAIDAVSGRPIFLRLLREEAIDPGAIAAFEADIEAWTARGVELECGLHQGRRFVAFPAIEDPPPAPVSKTRSRRRGAAGLVPDGYRLPVRGAPPRPKAFLDGREYTLWSPEDEHVPQEQRSEEADQFSRLFVAAAGVLVFAVAGITLLVKAAL